MRVAVACHLRGCPIGDTGTVRELSKVGMIGALYYIVGMDEAEQARMAPVFAEDEIKADV